MFGLAGMLLGLGLFAGGAPVLAAESGTSGSATISQTDVITLQASLNSLRIVLGQLGGYLKNGQIAATQYAEIGGILSSAQVNLFALSSTLANVSVVSPVYVSVPTSDVTKSETRAAPKPKDETPISLDQNIAPLKEEFPAVTPVSQANLFSVLTPKTVTGIVLVIGLIAVVVFSLRKRTKVETKVEAEAVNADTTAT